MDYRDERDALRARVDELEEKLARADETIADLRGQRSARRMLRVRRAVRVGALALLAGLGVAGLVARLRRAPSRPASVQAADVEPAVPFAAASRPPMFARIDADAAPGSIAWGTSGDKACLAGFAARGGARLWLTCPYGPKATDDGRAAVIGDRLLVDFERKLDAFDLRSGARLWTTRLDERTFEYCLRPDGTLRLSQEGNGGTYVVSLGTGQLTPSTRTYDCQAIWDDWPWHGRGLPGQHVSSKGRFGAWNDPAPAVDGVVSEMAVRHGGRTIALGYGKPGRHAPVAAALGSKGELLWKRVLPPEDPPLADAGGPFFAVLDDRRLCAVYPGQAGRRLGCWDAATGATLWDVAVEEPIGGFHGLALAEPQVILLYWRGFAAFDLANGALAYDVR